MSNINEYDTFKDSPEQLISIIYAKDSLLAEREKEIDKLHHLLIQARKNLFGRKSEKLTAVDQQEPFSFAQADLAILEETTESESVSAIEVPAHTRKVRTKSELPNDLERERIEYDLEDIHCPCCKREMAIIGEDKSEELEFVPAKFKVFEHIRIRRACGSCKNGVYSPKLPPEVKPLERRRAGAGLLAQIVVSKYQDHLPLYRQEQIFQRNGVTVPRKVMCNWVEGVAELLIPLYQELKKELLQENYLQADETTIKVQDPEVKDRLHTGYLWAMLGPPNRVLFHYAESRAQEVPRTLFKDFQGAIQTDAYAGYNPVFLPDKCQRIACMAHIRRKFIEAQATSKSAAGKILELIAELYKTEKNLKKATPEERHAQRKKKSFCVLKKLYRLIKTQRKSTLPQSPYAKALEYAYSQRYPMLNYLRNGSYELDNNLIENQMRPVALGRKNYLFAGSHDGAKRAAVIYTFLNTCKLNKINSLDWLRDVLKRVHTHPASRISELLPHNWKKTPETEIK